MRRRWVVVAAAVLVVCGCTRAADGGIGSDPEPAPSATPSWTPGTVVPSVARCAEGATPGRPRRADLPSPIDPAAIDAQSGQLVVVSSYWGRTTSFDVCTNTWASPKRSPWTQASWGGPAVVYDPGTDALIALTVSETHNTQAETYSSATHAWTRTRNPQKLLPWAYSVDLDRWALLPPIGFPAGLESAAVTHGVLDPTTGQVLFLMESAGSRTLWSYSPGWRTLTQLGGQVPAGRSGDPTLILDAGARRLVLILWGSSVGIPGETWTFDLFTQRWTNQHAEPPGPNFDETASSLLEPHREAAFDPVSQRTFVLRNGELATYQAGTDHWDAVTEGAGAGWPSSGWGTGPLKRTGHSLVYDPVNQRILVFGGTWQTTNGEERTGDVWAYDAPTNTWTELVGPIAGSQ